MATNRRSAHFPPANMLREANTNIKSAPKQEYDLYKELGSFWTMVWSHIKKNSVLPPHNVWSHDRQVFVCSHPSCRAMMKKHCTGHSKNADSAADFATTTLGMRPHQASESNTAPSSSYCLHDYMKMMEPSTSPPTGAPHLFEERGRHIGKQQRSITHIESNAQLHSTISGEWGAQVRD